MKVKGKHIFEKRPKVNGVDAALSNEISPLGHKHGDISVSGTNGLTGGGDLSDSRVISLGVPGTLSTNSINEFDGDTHRHLVNFPVISVASKTGVITLNKSDVGLSNVDNTSDLAKPVSDATQTALNLKISADLIGAANGVASLDANQKVPLSQINDSLIGQVEYRGVWNASTNTPTLPTTPTEKGHYYVTSVAGSRFGHSFEIGDWVISNGASWDKVDNTDAVSSVAGKTGVVTLVASDVGAPPTTRSISAGVGLSGGGDLSANRSIAMGTPSTLTTSTTNSVSGTTHAHAVTFPVTSVASKTGAVTLTATDVGLGSVLNTAQMNKVSSGSTTDPNTTLDSLILTNHSNSPNTSIYWHILTLFYSSVSTSANRAQIAIPYNGTAFDGMIFTRKSSGSTWDSWVSYGSRIRTSAPATPVNGDIWMV